MRNLIKYTLVFWLLVGRFILNDDYSFSGNISALVIAYFLLYFENSLLTQIALLVSLSLYYSSFLAFIGIIQFTGLIGSVAAALTLSFNFKYFNNGGRFA